MSSSSVTNIKLSNEKLSFNINNLPKKSSSQFQISLMNAIRRIIIANLPCYAIDRNSTKFHKNSTVFNSDYLTLRLSLLPLNYKQLEKYDIDDIEISLEKKNVDDIIIDITLKDFQIKLNETPIDTKSIFEHINILFCRLKPNDELSFTTKIKKSTHKQSGSGFSLTSKAVYTFEQDDDAINKEIKKLNIPKKDENNFRLSKQERIYKKTDDGKPKVFNWSIESIGILPVKDIFTKACDYLLLKCSNTIETIQKQEIGYGDTLTIEESPINLKAWDFIFENEDDTLGNLLQSYLFEFGNVEYVGYVIPHPLDKKMVLRIALKSHDIKDYKKKLEDVINIIIQQIKTIKKDFQK